MRVLVLNWKCLRDWRAGGAEQYLRGLLRVLLRLGYEVKLLVPHCGVEHDFVEVPEGTVPVEHVGTIYTHYLATPLLSKYREYDLVIENLGGGCGYPIPTPQVLGIVHHVHSEQYFIEEPLWRAGVAYVWEYLTLRRPRPLVTVSRYVAEVVRRRGGRVLAIIHPYLEQVPELRPVERDIDVLYLGRVRRYKYLHHLLYAVHLLRRVQDEVRVVVAGRGDPELYTLLRRVSERLGLRTQFLGEVSEEVKWRLFSRAKVLVLTSYREGFSYTALEAQTCGTPVVAYDSGGVRDVVLHGVTGLLVPWGDVVKLTRALQYILVPEVWRRFSERARSWAQNFTFEKFYRYWSHVLETLVS